MERALVAGAVFALVVGGWSAAPAEGADVYKERCASCHGETGHADTPVGKALKATELAGNAKLAGMSDADLVAEIKANPKHGGFIKKVSDDDIAATAAHVKQLAGAK